MGPVRSVIWIYAAGGRPLFEPSQMSRRRRRRRGRLGGRPRCRKAMSPRPRPDRPSGPAGPVAPPGPAGPGGPASPMRAGRTRRSRRSANSGRALGAGVCRPWRSGRTLFPSEDPQAPGRRRARLMLHTSCSSPLLMDINSGQDSGRVNAKLGQAKNQMRTRAPVPGS